MNNMRLSRTTLRRGIAVVAMLACTLEASGQSTSNKAGPESPVAKGHCLFVPETLIPRMAMGVRRKVTDQIEEIELRDRPGGKVIARTPLFQLLYIRDERLQGDLDWVLLSDRFAGESELTGGWTERRNLECFKTRNAYAFNDIRGQLEFFPSPAQAYSLVQGVQEQIPASPSPQAAVLSNEKMPGWQPSMLYDRVPFMELEYGDSAGYPATTPSLETAFDGRLVRVAAVCGGPVDESLIASFKNDAAQSAAVEMLFVVDETWSMKPYFAGVADFIATVGKAVEGGFSQRPKIAVAYYTDGPPGQRTTPSALQLATPEVVAKMVKEVREHEQKMPPGDYDNPPERLLEGLRDAIRTAAFTKGANCYVVVIGDTGHEPTDTGKLRLIDEVAKYVANLNLAVFFTHVAANDGESVTLFKTDASDVARAALAYKVPAGRIKYQTANATTLAAELDAVRRQADELAKKARVYISRIKSRNTATVPGGALIKDMAGAGVSLADFNRANLQLYVPSFVWLASPRERQQGGQARCRLTRYVALSPVEKAGLTALLTACEKDFAAGTTLEHDKAVLSYAEAASKSAGNESLRQLIVARWNSLSTPRTIGMFRENRKERGG